MKRTEFTQGWLDALRSGEFKQGHGQLYGNGKYCCLGVAATLCGVSVSDEGYENYRLIDSKMGLDEDERQTLAHENDSGEKTFLDLADMIENSLKPE